MKENLKANATLKTVLKINNQVEAPETAGEEGKTHMGVSPFNCNVWVFFDSVSSLPY